MISRVALLAIMLGASLLLNMLVLIWQDRRRAKACTREKQSDYYWRNGSSVDFAVGDRVLVTGAAGFIGMHTALRLVLSKGNGGAGVPPGNVIGIDSFEDYYSVKLKRARAAELERAGIPIVETSVCDHDIMSELFRKHQFSHVIHLAAQPGTRHGPWRNHINNNVNCFSFLVETIVRMSPRAHLIYASSSSVYGASTRTPFSEYDLLDNPSTLDGATKRTNELLAFAYHSSSGLHSTGLRFFTVYGEWGRPDMAVYTFSHAIGNRIPIPVHGTGRMSRDFIYIGDIVDGIILASQYRAPPEERVGLPSSGVPRPEIFNLGSGRPTKVTELIRILEGRLNGTAIVEEGGGRSWEEVTITHADISKATSVLGWKPRTPVEEGVGRFAAWYQANASARPEFYAEGRLQREGGAGATAPPHWDIPVPAQQVRDKWSNEGSKAKASDRGDGEALRRRAVGAPVIAVITGTTSRNLSIKSVQEHPVLTLMIHSLLGTLEDGYEYWVYVGYDAGDAMFEDPAARANLSQLFAERAQNLLSEREIVAQLAFVRVSNPLHRPGPVFNFVSAAAFDDGADYFFRVNDDTEFKTVWARKLVQALTSFAPPNLGAVSPSCDVGNKLALMFDFTHRTHRQVFGVHYPPALTEWWMDDWISAVYPKSNVRRVPDVQVRHITQSHGRKQDTRYLVDLSKKAIVGDLVKEGRTMLSRYLGSSVLGQCDDRQNLNLNSIRDILSASSQLSKAILEPMPSFTGPSTSSSESIVNRGARAQSEKQSKKNAVSTQVALSAVTEEVDNSESIKVVQRVASESTYSHPWAIIMVVNTGILDMALNWICNMGNKGLTKILRSTVYVALDDQAYTVLSAAGHTTVKLIVTGPGWSEKQSYGSAGYFAVIHTRQKLILDCLKHNISVLVAEPDATWYGDLIDFVESTDQFRSADVLAYNDALNDKLSIPCGGLLFLRATPNSQALMQELLKKHKEGLLKSKGVLPEQNVLKHVWKTAKGSFVFLPAAKFKSGSWYKSKTSTEEGLLYIHANYMIGVDNKIASMRSRRQWFLGPGNVCQPTPVEPK